MRYLIFISLLVTFVYANPPQYKVVNGVQVPLTQDEINSIQAEWNSVDLKQQKDKLSKEQALQNAKLADEVSKQVLVVPNLSQVQINAIILPHEGRLVFNTTTKKMNYYNGLTWIEF